MSKGTRNERRAVAALQHVGYATYRPATVRYGENDVWGLFDVLAMAPHRPPRMVQVKSNTPTGIKRWSRCTHLWRSHGFLTEMWVWHDQQGWSVHDPAAEPTDGRRDVAVVYDERDDDRVGTGSTTPLTTGEGIREWLKDG